MFRPGQTELSDWLHACDHWLYQLRPEREGICQIKSSRSFPSPLSPRQLEQSASPLTGWRIREVRPPVLLSSASTIPAFFKRGCTVGLAPSAMTAGTCSIPTKCQGIPPSSLLKSNRCAALDALGELQHDPASQQNRVHRMTDISASCPVSMQGQTGPAAMPFLLQRP